MKIRIAERNMDTVMDMGMIMARMFLLKKRMQKNAVISKVLAWIRLPQKKVTRVKMMIMVIPMDMAMM
jgi:hypothetical protein